LLVQAKRLSRRIATKKMYKQHGVARLKIINTQLNMTHAILKSSGALTHNGTELSAPST
jgi:hypothetical protein